MWAMSLHSPLPSHRRRCRQCRRRSVSDHPLPPQSYRWMLLTARRSQSSKSVWSVWDGSDLYTSKLSRRHLVLHLSSFRTRPCRRLKQVRDSIISYRSDEIRSFFYCIWNEILQREIRWRWSANTMTVLRERETCTALVGLFWHIPLCFLSCASQIFPSFPSLVCLLLFVSK